MKKVKKQDKELKNKTDILNVCNGILQNTLSIAANNIFMEAAVALNYVDITPGSKIEADKIKSLDILGRAINGELTKAKLQFNVYLEALIEEE